MLSVVYLALHLVFSTPATYNPALVENSEGKHANLCANRAELCGVSIERFAVCRTNVKIDAQYLYYMFFFFSFIASLTIVKMTFFLFLLVMFQLTSINLRLEVKKK